MGDLSEHFSRWEFDCPCSYPDCWTPPINMSIINRLEIMREKCNKESIKRGGTGNYALHINSGLRCKKHNFDIGGVERSRHKVGDASDIRHDFLPASVVTAIALRTFPESCGIGGYRLFTHLDSKPGKKRRWGIMPNNFVKPKTVKKLTFFQGLFRIGRY